MTEHHAHGELTRTVPAVESRRCLLGFMSRDEAISKLESSNTLGDPVEPFDDGGQRRTGDDLRDAYGTLWEDAKAGIDPDPTFEAKDVQLQDLPDHPAVQDHVNEFLDEPHFRSSMADRSDDRWALKEVPLEHLVAYQRSVATGAYADRVAGADGGVESLLELTLPVDPKLLVEYQRIRDDHFTGIQYVSRSPNIHLGGPHYRRDDGDNTVFASVSFDIKTDPNFLYVARFEDRYILKNGYHRAYQLLKSGETRVPAVVLQAEEYADTGAARSGFFDRELVMGDRPPMVPDYLSDAAVDIDRRAKNRVVRIMAETTDVVR